MNEQPTIPEDLVEGPYVYDLAKEAILPTRELRLGMVSLITDPVIRMPDADGDTTRWLETHKPYGQMWGRVVRVELGTDYASVELAYADGGSLRRYFPDYLLWYVKKYSILD